MAKPVRVPVPVPVPVSAPAPQSRRAPRPQPAPPARARSAHALALHNPPPLARGHIHYSGDQLLLEIVALLDRSGQDDDGRELPLAWTASAVADELQAEPDAVLQTLDFLVYQGRACGRLLRSGHVLYRRMLDSDSAWQARHGSVTLTTSRLAGRYLSGDARGVA